MESIKCLMDMAYKPIREHLRRRNGTADLKPKHFFGFTKPILPISNLAYSFFAKNRQKTKKLDFLTHVAFFKSILAIPKQSTLIFASTKTKTNKLCCSPAIIGVLCTFFAHGLFAPKSAPQAYGTFYFYNDT
jgi:hypothetical protein